jgi:hypothetical protein
LRKGTSTTRDDATRNLSKHKSSFLTTGFVHRWTLSQFIMFHY